MAELLVNTLSGPLEPERYRDEYREKLLGLIAEKAGQAPTAAEPEPPPAPTGVEELMTALTASIEAARAKRDAGRAAG
jgi:DNA end-binding protein Ku